MFCSKCGTKNDNGEVYCKNCGCLLNNQSQNNNQPTSNLDPNYADKAINPNMKKWAILSIVIGVGGIIFYWFIGLTVYIAIILASAGFSFAAKGKIESKKIALIGQIANGILFAMAIIMFILGILGLFE